jgi:hypothetical protein
MVVKLGIPAFLGFLRSFFVRDVQLAAASSGQTFLSGPAGKPAQSCQFPQQTVPSDELVEVIAV